MRKYRLVSKKGEGTFSEVLKAQNIKDGKYHAVKCMKNHFDSINEVNNLREIQALRRLSPHEHIIALEEVLYDQPSGRLALVFELMDGNLYELIRGRRHYLSAATIQSYVYQLLLGLEHMHRKGIFHRDIKPENILIDSAVHLSKSVKLADFGSCRGIYSKHPYTEYISTRWYRAPECLLTDGFYGPEMDIWGAGCVFFEITSLYPLFPGTNELDQISRIHKVIGTPDPSALRKLQAYAASHADFNFPQQEGIGIRKLIRHASADGVDLMEQMLLHDSAARVPARDALGHAFFDAQRRQREQMVVAHGGPTKAEQGGSNNSVYSLPGGYSLPGDPVVVKRGHQSDRGGGAVRRSHQQQGGPVAVRQPQQDRGGPVAVRQPQQDRTVQHQDAPGGLARHRKPTTHVAHPATDGEKCAVGGPSGSTYSFADTHSVNTVNTVNTVHTTASKFDKRHYASNAHVGPAARGSIRALPIQQKSILPPIASCAPHAVSNAYKVSVKHSIDARHRKVIPQTKYPLGNKKTLKHPANINSRYYVRRDHHHNNNKSLRGGGSDDRTGPKVYMDPTRFGNHRSTSIMNPAHGSHALSPTYS